MKNTLQQMGRFGLRLLVSAALLVPQAYAVNDVLGEVHLKGKSHVEKTSGVWVDGQYVGYLKELKGSKKLLLLPGEHEIVVRQNGYQGFARRVVVRPGYETTVPVAMSKGESGFMPARTAEVKLTVNPSRAAVFVDGQFAGHVGEFEGMGRAMLVAPGKHQIRIALPGYDTFEAEINPLPDQKVNIKTELLETASPTDDPMLKPGSQAAATPTPGPGN